MIPLATTTITVLRLPASIDPVDPYDEPAPRVVSASGVRAHLSALPRKDAERVAGGSQSITDYRLACDPVDVTNLDQVIDDSTGLVYDVTFATLRIGLGLDHIEGGLRRVVGVV